MMMGREGGREGGRESDGDDRERVASADGDVVSGRGEGGERKQRRRRRRRKRRGLWGRFRSARHGRRFSILFKDMHARAREERATMMAVHFDSI